MVVTRAPLERHAEIKPGRVRRIDQHVGLLWHNHRWHLSQQRLPTCNPLIAPVRRVVHGWRGIPTTPIIWIEEAALLPVLAWTIDRNQPSLQRQRLIAGYGISTATLRNRMHANKMHKKLSIVEHLPHDPPHRFRRWAMNQVFVHRGERTSLQIQGSASESH